MDSQRQRWTGAGRAARGLVILAIAVLSSSASADYPSWWTNRNVVATNAGTVTNDWAAVNAGQVKWIASNAMDELDANLSGGAGTNIQSMVSGFSSTNNRVGVNQGQLKYVSSKFYDRFIAEGFTNTYPWTTNTTSDDKDFAAANIGQVKYLFNFNLGTDSDSDSLPDWWEMRWFASTTNQDGFSDFNCNGTNNHDEFHASWNPYDGIWVESAGNGEATLAWHPATNSAIAGFNYNLFTNGVQTVTNLCFGSNETTSITISNLLADAELIATVYGTNSSEIVVSSNSVAWTQPGSYSGMTNTFSTYLMPAIPLQSISGPSRIIASKTVSAYCLWKYDRFYVSGSPTNVSGFNLTGCRIEITSGATQDHPVCGYGDDPVEPLDATQDSSGDFIVQSEWQNVKIQVRYDGTSGQVEVSKPLYLLKWRPGLTVQ